MSRDGRVLLIEDDHVDAMIVRRAFKELKIKKLLINVSDGEQALEYLRSIRNSLPRLILLDLNTPRMNGFEFLKIIKADETLRIIPVVILTTSNQTSDIIKAYKMGAAGYIVKSVSYYDFVKSIDALNRYWNLCKLPRLCLSDTYQKIMQLP